MVIVLGPKDKRPYPLDIINCTSRSNDFGRELSPFLCGPVEIPCVEPDNFHYSNNVENAWQYSKVYKGQTNLNGNPSSSWWRWALDGWSKNRAVRYPMGKGVTPLYHYYKGKHLSKIEARRQMYIPWYAKAVTKTEAFKRLERMHNRSVLFDEGPLYLWDFDGYNYREQGLSYKEVIENPNRSLGHGFVIAMLLEDYIDENGQETGKFKEEKKR